MSKHNSSTILGLRLPANPENKRLGAPMTTCYVVPNLPDSHHPKGIKLH
jgi:hypothetical protein